MKNGISYKIRLDGCHDTVCCTMCILVILVSLAACRSSRNVVEKTHGEIHATFKETAETDTVRATTATSETHTDSINSRADEQGSVTIHRDSAGRAVRINWRIRADFEKIKRAVSAQNLRLYESKESRSSENSENVDYVDTKKEEISEEIDTSIPLECLIGWSIVALLILFYTGDYIYRIWKRKRKE